jgi:hypothetical protein
MIDAASADSKTVFACVCSDADLRLLVAINAQTRRKRYDRAFPVYVWRRNNDL